MAVGDLDLVAVDWELIEVTFKRSPRGPVGGSKKRQ